MSTQTVYKLEVLNPKTGLWHLAGPLEGRGYHYFSEASKDHAVAHYQSLGLETKVTPVVVEVK